MSLFYKHDVDVIDHAYQTDEVSELMNYLKSTRRSGDLMASQKQ